MVTIKIILLRLLSPTTVFSGREKEFLRLTFVFFTFISVGSRGIRYESEAFGVSRDVQMAGFVFPPYINIQYFKKEQLYP